MARRNFKKLIEEGRKLAGQKNCQLYTDEIQQLRDLADNDFDLIELTYYAGLAAGYRSCKKDEN